MSETHEYDALGRLKASERGNDALSYCFDELGNRVELKASTVGAIANCTAPAPTPAPSPTPTPTPPPPPPSNTPPVTTADSVSGTCNTSIPLNLVGNDSDQEDDLAGIASPSLVSVERSSGALATATVTSSTHVQIAFGPTVGDTQLIYTVEDSDGARSTGQLFVTTTPPAQGICNV